VTYVEKTLNEVNRVLQSINIENLSESEKNFIYSLIEMIYNGISEEDIIQYIHNFKLENKVSNIFDKELEKIKDILSVLKYF